MLETALHDRVEGAEYVFPSAANMLVDNNTGLTWRFKKLVVAVIPDPEVEEAAPADRKSITMENLADVLQEVSQSVSQHLEGKVLNRTLETLRLYAINRSVRKIETATGRSKSTISADLHRAEELSGKRFMTVVATGGGMRKLVDRVTRTGILEKVTHSNSKRKPKGRSRRASVLDWHALRVTWVTLALSAGVPIEVARLVTGHQTVDVVLRHYFKPRREHLRAVLGDKLPDVLTGRKKDAKPIDPTPTATLPTPNNDTMIEIAAKLKSLTPAEKAQLASLLS